jgi:hypothetical protein
MVSMFFSFHYPIDLLIFLLLEITYFTYLKMLTETLLRIIFYVIGRCPLVSTSHWLQGKGARINLSKAASGMILQKHSVKIADLGSLKRVTGRIFKISK